MGWWSHRRMLMAALAGFAIYFAIASYLKYNYVAEPKLTKRVYLKGPFKNLGGYAWYAQLPEKYAADADSTTNFTRSGFRLYENRKPIGPPHSSHVDIAELGGGRYSHWRVDAGSGIIFSATDNSNPNKSSRSYFYLEDR
jgi:hypothetical protein